MDQNVGTSLYLLHKSFVQVLQNFHAVPRENKLQIRTLTINYSDIDRFEQFILSHLENLTRLDLSKCNIKNVHDNVFDHLIHLSEINLSYNLIESVDTKLFRNNRELKSIWLHNNLLTNFDKNAFLNLNNLEILDLSGNRISKLKGRCLNCPNLKVLRLSNNHIKDVHENAFLQLPMLSSLFLNNNAIATIERVYLANNTKLNQLDLSDNYLRIFKIWMFQNFRYLEILSLTVVGSFEIRTIKNLKFLMRFHLNYKKGTFWWCCRFQETVDQLINLTILKLVFEKFVIGQFCNFSKLQQLESLHIECKYPNENNTVVINLMEHFSRMPHLERLVLVKLNAFRISGQSVEIDNLRHLCLSGVKNDRFVRCFSNFILLEFLDLSFSEIELILPSTFGTLVHLRHLKLQHTNLRSIKSTAFQHNVKLQVLMCSNCRLEAIEDDSFINLHSLRVLNLYGNPSLHSSSNMFNGLDIETCVIIL